MSDRELIRAYHFDLANPYLAMSDRKIWMQDEMERCDFGGLKKNPPDPKPKRPTT